jgi:glutathione synthase/RimK-type ligase-like ATP-grasp enzyme
VTPPRLAVVGNPANRRVTLFTDAARAAGLPAPRVVPWLDVLRGEFSFVGDEYVRIDSPGEDAEVAQLLHGCAEPVDMYRVEGSARWYRGFVGALDRLHQAIDAAGAVVLADRDETATAFDKARTHALLAAKGVAVPESLGPVDGYDSVLSALTADQSGGAAFVKIRHGSSASGVVALTARGGRARAVTSAELVRTPDGIELYNSLRVRAYDREEDIAAVIDTLAKDGLHAERWIPKLKQDGRDCDLRVVTIAGTATHVVVRTSGHPMTNLHLGGQRGDLAAFQERVGPVRWRTILDLAEQAASCFPRSDVLGIDILPGARDVDYVGEVNAYGDLLPNLLGRPGTVGEGVDTYGAHIRSLIDRCSA